MNAGHSQTVEYFVLFLDKLGCIRNFAHLVKLNEATQPVQQKLRRLPLAVRDKVEAELNKLLADGVIEPV